MNKAQFTAIKAKLAELIKDTEFENKVYAVGGCIRDMLLGDDIKDIDLAVNLPGGGIKLADYLYIHGHLVLHPVTYPVYGTAMFKLSAFPDVELEAVQTRKEKYTDPRFRNPESVFGTIEEDCLRRDLTINSLYQNVNTDEIIDITKHGLYDLNDEVIRTPCDPDVTYDDDPLRILRTVRFASRYNWKIEKKTMEAMKRNVHRLGIITKERINTELTKMLICNEAVYAMNTLKEIGAFYIIAPEIQKMIAEDNDKWTNTMIILDNLCRINKIELSLAAFLCTLCAEYDYPVNSGLNNITFENGVTTVIAEDFMRDLKYSNNVINRVCKMIQYHRIVPYTKLISRIHIEEPFTYTNNIKFEVNFRTLREFQYKIKEQDLFNDIMVLSESWWMTTDMGRICNPFPGIVETSTIHNNFFTYTLPVTGDDLINECGMQPGKEIKIMLNKLMDCVFDTPELTKEDLLIIVKHNLNLNKE